MKGWFGGVLAWLGMVGLWWSLSLPFNPWPPDACRLVLGPWSGSLSIFSLRSLPTTSPQPTRDRAGGGESLANDSPHPEPYALSMAIDTGPPWLDSRGPPRRAGDLRRTATLHNGNSPNGGKSILAPLIPAHKMHPPKNGGFVTGSN